VGLAALRMRSRGRRSTNDRRPAAASPMRAVMRRPSKAGAAHPKETKAEQRQLPN
jgi:hypothetical protein